MKIADVRAHVLEAKLSQPFSYARAWYGSRTALIVEIVTDQGHVGWGECYGPARINAGIEHRNGRVAVPSGAGLGIDIDRAALARFRVTS